MSLTPGTRLGPYEILSLLGAGGMGEVYKARDPRLDRFVAVKVLPAERTADPNRKRRFIQEAKSASALNHPNIVTIHEINQQDGVDYIVMEFVDGQTLDALIPRNGLRLAETLKIATQIAEGLARAHGAGIVHRDLKPGNVMVGASGLVKVLDFGLAKLLEKPEPEPSESTRTVADRPESQEGAIAGTPSYMSPEQAEGRKIDARSDIFSFGALLYEMVTGQRAFRGDNAMSTISAILRDDPKPAGELSPDVPRDLDKIVARCLRKDPERRFQNMADARVALLELKEESETGKLPAAPVAPAPAPKRTRFRLIAACAVLLVSAAVYFGLRSRTARPEAMAVPRTVPFSSYTTPQSAPAFSPDANQIAFAWSGDQGSNFHIYVKLIGTETPLQLTSGDVQDSAPAWAPGAGVIAFSRQLPDGSGGIYQVSALGGPVRRITDLTIAARTRVSWSPNGKWLIASGGDSPTAVEHLWRIDGETGEKQVLFGGEVRPDSCPAISPDGKLLAFSRGLGDLRDGIFVVDLDPNLRPNDEPRQLPAPPGVNWHPAWGPDGDIVFVNYSSSGYTLWRVPSSGKSLARQVAIAPQGSSFPAIAAGAHRLAYAWLSFRDDNIWRIPLLGPGKVGPSALFVASSRADDVRPGAFSPDGRKIAFESGRSGSIGVWTAGADGSNPSLLFSGPDYLSGSPIWSPDGRQVIFDSRKGGQAAIYRISADGGAPVRMFNIPWDHVAPMWSRDGKWIYFTSARTGRQEVYKALAAGGEPVLVTRNGGFGPTESPDGKFLYYTRTRGANSVVAPPSGPLLRMPVEGGEETEVLPAAYQRSWIVTEQGVWFLWPHGLTGGELRFYDFATKKTTTAAQFPVRVYVGLAISPDGRTLLYNRMDRQTSEIALVENFR